MGSLYRDRDARLEPRHDPQRTPGTDAPNCLLVAGAGVAIGVLVAIAAIRLFTL